MVEYNPKQIREYITNYGLLIKLIFDVVDKDDEEYWNSLEKCLKNCKKIPKELRPDNYEENMRELVCILDHYKKDRNS